MRRYFLNIILVVCLLFFQVVYSQPPLHTLQKLTTLDGLSNNIVEDIIQDAQGYLWATTYNGLNRYDGSEITRFYVDPKLSSPTGNIMSKILDLGNHKLAVCTYEGLLIFNTRTYEQKIVRFDHEKINQIDSVGLRYLNQIKVLKKDESGNIWVATPLSLYRLDSSFKIQKAFWAGYSQSEIAAQRLAFVKKIFTMQEGAVLLLLDKGVYVWEKPKGNNSEKLIPVELWKNGRLAFLKDQADFYAFGTNKSNLVTLDILNRRLNLVNTRSGKKVSCKLYFNPGDISYKHNIGSFNDTLLTFSFDRFGFSFIKINETDNDFSIHCLRERYFVHNKFGKIIQDREKNIYATTSFEGIINIPHQERLFTENLLPEINQENKSIYQIACFYQRGKRIYVGCSGAGLYERDLTSGILTHLLIPKSQNGLGGYIWNIRPGKRDTLWLGTGSGLFWFDPVTKKYGRPAFPFPKELEGVAITTQFTDSHGLVWMGLGLGKGLAVLDPATNEYFIYRNQYRNYPHRYPLAMAEDSKSNLWFISDNSPDLVKWNRRTNEFSVIEVPFGMLTVWGTIYIDKKDCIWFGLLGTGLIRYDSGNSNSVPESVDSKNLSDCWGNITEDEQGRLWFSSNDGPVCYDKHTGRIMRFNIAGPLFVTDIHPPFHFDSASNTCYIGFFKKIIAFKPEDIGINKNPLPVYLTGLKINGTDVQLPQDRKIKLSYKQNDLTIYFTGLNLSTGKDNRYAYKISGDEWTDIGDQKLIHFARLTPGNYNLEIRGARAGEDWSPVTEHLFVSIIPPFTRTLWFYLCILTGISLLIYAWYRHRLRQFMKLQKVRSEISSDLHDELGSRLTSLSYLSLIAQKKFPVNGELGEVLKKINQSSMKVSSSLREIIWGINPELDKLNRLIPHLRQYAAETLELREIEFHNIGDEIPDRFKLAQKARRDLELIFKETINNILKHSHAKNVIMIVSHDKKYLNLSVQDDGKGLDPDALSGGNGLTNMKKRATQQGWGLTMTSGKDTGTTISLKVKIT